MTKSYLKYVPGQGYKIVTPVTEEVRMVRDMSRVGRQMEREKVYESRDVTENVTVQNEDLENVEVLKRIFIQSLSKNKSVKTLKIINQKADAFVSFAICSIKNDFKEHVINESRESPFLVKRFEDNLNENYFGCFSQPVLSKEKTKDYEKIKLDCMSSSKDEGKIIECISEKFHI
jgi:hypothetical protein